jgi:hypothetical protein
MDKKKSEFSIEKLVALLAASTTISTALRMFTISKGKKAIFSQIL